MGASGGILSLLDTSEVEVWHTRSLENALIINGRFVKIACIFFVSNVYACDSSVWVKLLIS